MSAVNNSFLEFADQSIAEMIKLTPNPLSTSESARPRIRLLAIIEASTVTGPAKNLLEFCRISRDLETGPIIEASLLTFQRNGEAAPAAQLERGGRAIRVRLAELLAGETGLAKASAPTLQQPLYDPGPIVSGKPGLE